MRRDSINTKSAYLEVGFLAQKELPQQDLDPFLKSLLAQNFRARTSEQYTAAALEHLRRWKSCCDLWNSVDLSDLDFAEQHKLRTEFFLVRGFHKRLDQEPRQARRPCHDCTAISAKATGLV